MNEEIIILEDEVELIEEIVVAESVGTYSGSGAVHSNLGGRNDPEQHEISAITGLEAKLDAIESLQTVYSDGKLQADYYKWYDENPKGEDRSGLFVTTLQDENGAVRIKPCDADSDVVGVTVSEAGLIGGQPYNLVRKANDAALKQKNDNEIYKYGLVTTSGVVAVQRELNVTIGDYVVPNASGKAKKSDGKYGYLVTALRDNYGVACAVISLAAPSTFAKELADTAADLSTRMTTAETNIGSLTTLAQDAYDLAQANQSQMKENTSNVQDALDKVEDLNGAVSDLQGAISDAVTKAEYANATALSMRSEAVDAANQAVASVTQVQKEIQALDYQIADYSIGEYSQAYGLTWEQAKAALTAGQVHIPTVVPYYEEVYDGYSEPQKFYRQYYYTWDGEKWNASTSNAVVFSSTYYQVSETVPYLVAEADIALGDGTIYAKKGDVLYYNGGEPYVVTSAEKNGFSRAVNYLRKSANETSMEITNAKGDMAAMQTKLDADGARTAMVASVVTELEGVKPAMTVATFEELPPVPDDADAYYCVGERAPYDVYKWDGDSWVKQVILYYDGVNFFQVNTASIMAAVNADGDSEIKLNADRIDFASGEYAVSADKINFSGYSTFINTDENGGITSINGGIIKTGTIDASQITTGTFGADVGYIGKLDASQITTGTLNADIVKAIELDASQITTGELKATYIEVKNGDKTIFMADSDAGDVEIDVACITGELTTDVIQSSNYQPGGARLWSDDSINNDVVLGGLSYTKQYNGSYTYYIVKGDGISKDKVTDIVIPDRYNGYPVTIIGQQAFQEYTALKRIIIPNSISIIQGSAFKWCDSLTNITLPKSITSINQDAFNSCASLKNIVIPAGVVFIGATAFQYCNNLQIYCEATSKPDFWDSTWNYSNCPVYWYSNTQPSDTSKYWRYTDTYGVQVSSQEPYLIDSAFFKVTHDGMITATNVNIKGDIEATCLNSSYSSKDGIVSCGTIVADNDGFHVNCLYGTGNLKGTWRLNSAEITTSDKALKHDIEVLSDKYTTLFDNLTPVRFKYNDGTSDRYHTGFIAQDVEQAVEESGLTTQDFAAFVQFEKDCGLRYSEFIALCVKEIQDLKKKVVELEDELKIQQNYCKAKDGAE